MTATTKTTPETEGVTNARALFDLIFVLGENPATVRDVHFAWHTDGGQSITVQHTSEAQNRTARFAVDGYAYMKLEGAKRVEEFKAKAS